MSKKSNGNIREMVAAIDFFRAAKNQAPNDNETIQNILTGNENILKEQLFQRIRQDNVPVMTEQQLVPSKRKSKGKEVIETGIDPRRAD